MWFHSKTHRQHRREVERAKDARLAHAEGQLADLKDRADKAIVILDIRSERNHFADAIRKTIERG